MGRMLNALKQLEGRPVPIRRVAPAAVERVAVERVAVVETPAAGSEPSASLDPRYRDVVAAVLAQLAVHKDVALLVAGFAGEGPRGGQLAALYPVLAQHVEGGVMVVDADRRDASLAERFDIRREFALDDVLTRHLPWQSVVRTTGHAGLYVLPGGPRHKRSSTQGSRKDLGKKGFLKALSSLVVELRRAHRLVVLDTVLEKAGEMSDWAAVCDAAIMVARLSVTPRHRVREAIRAMQSHGGQVLGCVLLEY